MAKTNEAFKPRPPACGVVHGWLETGAIEELEDEAEHRGMHRDQLVAELLEAVIGHRLYSNLLDGLG